MAARSPLDPLQGIIPADSTIRGWQKHELKEWVYSLAEQLAAARKIVKAAKGCILIPEKDLPAAIHIPLPDGRVLGETQRIESLLDQSEAYRCAEILKKAYEDQKKK